VQFPGPPGSGSETRIRALEAELRDREETILKLREQAARSEGVISSLISQVASLGGEMTDGDVAIFSSKEVPPLISEQVSKQLEQDAARHKLLSIRQSSKEIVEQISVAAVEKVYGRPVGVPSQWVINPHTCKEPESLSIEQPLYSQAPEINVSPSSSEEMRSPPPCQNYGGSPQADFGPQSQSLQREQAIANRQAAIASFKRLSFNGLPASVNIAQQCSGIPAGEPMKK